MTVLSEPGSFVRLASLKTAAAFRTQAAALGIDLPCEDTILAGPASPLAQPLAGTRINGKHLTNRWAIQPMEGWDGTTTGGLTDDTRRRWRHFGESGAKMIAGGEAMAVRADGRANPRQLVITAANERDLAELREIAVRAHRELYGNADDLVVGFQLTLSGRFSQPHDHHRREPRVAFRHPLLDARTGVTSDTQLFSDTELAGLSADYVAAARIAWNVGADFVDLKHCHGYLLHELLGAHTRPGPFGGSFENRTRMLRELVAAIRASGNRIELGVRLSAFDLVPFQPDPATSRPGKPGRGVPMDFARYLPYRYGFGVNPANPCEPDLTETCQFAELCVALGVKVINLSAGSPYYNPHVIHPALHPPSDGYLPPEDPLVGVARQIGAVRQVKAHLERTRKPSPDGAGPVIIGSAYSYLQEYLPHVAQAVVRQGWTDLVGVGRMVLSYPTMLADAVATGAVDPKRICRTFSDCTTAPRHGLVSGCYPLDRNYAGKPEAAQLRVIKRG